LIQHILIKINALSNAFYFLKATHIRNTRQCNCQQQQQVPKCTCIRMTPIYSHQPLQMSCNCNNNSNQQNTQQSPSYCNCQTKPDEKCLNECKNICVTSCFNNPTVQNKNNCQPSCGFTCKLTCVKFQANLTTTTTTTLETPQNQEFLISIQKSTCDYKCNNLQVNEGCKMDCNCEEECQTQCVSTEKLSICIPICHKMCTERGNQPVLKTTTPSPYSYQSKCLPQCQQVCVKACFEVDANPSAQEECRGKCDDLCTKTCNNISLSIVIPCQNQNQPTNCICPSEYSPCASHSQCCRD
uniref:Cysteine rich repeat-containing domain protein n=1 Tax=Rhabditophanes sp. KR3021 TaxID=114890 RepID=A0AC35UHX7_9BILA